MSFGIAGVVKAVAVLLLAAGASTRFGSSKQLAKVGGKTLLQHSIDTANEAIPGEVYVVLGANAERIAVEVSAAKLIVNHRWQEGIGQSLAVGVEHLQHQYQAVLVLLADQARVQARHLKAMLKAFDDERIVCAHYQGARGVPAIFPNRYFDSLEQLSGDQGAKGILQKAEDSLVEMDLPEAAFDIDTVEDLSVLKGLNAPQ